MGKYRNLKIATLFVILSAPIVFAHPALAADGDIAQVESFIKSVIKVISGLAGLVAAGFFVAGGFGYIMSSGNPENLEKSKHTLLYSGVGLAIVIAAFVISNIVTGLATSAFGG